MYPVYDRSKEFTESKLQELRGALTPLVPSAAIALTCGSYARREASTESDLDFFIVVDEEGDATPAWVSEAENKIRKIVPNQPAEGGAFAQRVTKNELVGVIGGEDDTNQTITRRMLFLLEGEWLTAREDFHELRLEVLKKYLADSHADHQLAQFLLNDIIRYWRTITVDYEQKTSLQSKPKPWAVRNIKLAFSRKLIYASGLFSVALTADRTQSRKLEVLARLFSIPALERIEEICGESRARPVRRSYDAFLDAIESAEIRAHLNTLPKDARQTDTVFRDIKNEGHQFTRSLLQAFEKTFHSTHPIWRAVIF